MVLNVNGVLLIISSALYIDASFQSLGEKAQIGGL
jgi:hypothetical protein